MVAGNYRNAAQGQGDALRQSFYPFSFWMHGLLSQREDQMREERHRREGKGMGVMKGKQGKEGKRR